MSKFIKINMLFVISITLFSCNNLQRKEERMLKKIAKEYIDNKIRDIEYWEKMIKNEGCECPIVIQVW